jgi:hypothetical protein
MSAQTFDSLNNDETIGLQQIIDNMKLVDVGILNNRHDLGSINGNVEYIRSINETEDQLFRFHYNSHN